MARRDFSTLRNLMLGATAALALAACGGGDEAAGDAPRAAASQSQKAGDLFAADYRLKGATEVDAETLLAALPAPLTASFDAAQFDKDAGAVVYTNLFISLDGAPDGMGLRIDEARVWGADMAHLEALKAGGADKEAFKALFDRMLMTGVRSENLSFGATSIAMAYDAIALDGVSARGWLYEAAATEEGDAADAVPAAAAAFVALVQKSAAFTHALAVDKVIYKDGSFSAKDTEKGGEISGVIAESASVNYKGGDYESGYIRGLVTTTTGPAEFDPSLFTPSQEPNPELAAEIADNPMAVLTAALGPMGAHPVTLATASYAGSTMEQRIDEMALAGTKFAKALPYLVSMTLPPLTETDLIDYGTVTIKGQQESLDGVVYGRIEETRIDALKFHWLVPSEFKAVFKGMDYDVNAIVDLMEKQQLALATPETEAMIAATMEPVRASVEAFGLSRLTGDGDFSWDWDGESGDARSAFSAKFDELVSISYSTDLGGPDLAGWKAAIEQSEETGVFPVELLEFSGFDLSVTDATLIDRIFAVAGPQMGSTPEDLRASAPAMIRMFGGQMGQMAPELPGYAEAFAAFLEKGGALKISAAPEAAVSFADIANASQAAPQTMPSVVGLTVTHEAPAE